MAEQEIILPPRPLFDREPFTLNVIPLEEVKPGYLYHGEGGNIGSLAVSVAVDEELISFMGMYLRPEGYVLKLEDPRWGDARGTAYRPIKQMMPAPDLAGKYLLEWLHRMSQANARRLIGEVLNLCDEAKQDPDYEDYLDFLQKSLKALDRPLIYSD